MSKHLIINRLNQIQNNQSHKHYHSNAMESNSKISISTKTEQSPNQMLNSDFTFQDKHFVKSQASQFFSNFNPNIQMGYQKVPYQSRILSRCLEHELRHLQPKPINLDYSHKQNISPVDRYKLPNSLKWHREQPQNHMKNDSRDRNFSTYACAQSLVTRINTTISNMPLRPQRSMIDLSEDKLRNQLSERYLFGKPQSVHPIRMSAREPSYDAYDFEKRAQSIRQQFNKLYQEENAKYKLIRDKNIYETNSRNSLRKIGSLCKI